MKKLTDKLIDIFLQVFILLGCIVLVGMIPSLIWLASGVVSGIVNWIDKIIVKGHSFFHSLGWIKYLIDIVLGICLYIWYRNKHKRNGPIKGKE